MPDPNITRLSIIDFTCDNWSEIDSPGPHKDDADKEATVKDARDTHGCPYSNCVDDEGSYKGYRYTWREGQTWNMMCYQIFAWTYIHLSPTILILLTTSAYFGFQRLFAHETICNPNLPFQKFRFFEVQWATNRLDLLWSMTLSWTLKMMTNGSICEKWW